MEFTASELVLKLFNFVGPPLLGVGVAVSGNGIFWEAGSCPYRDSWCCRSP